jgi:dTDP-4-amino-4,6-dideoxygalactose transaminase
VDKPTIAPNVSRTPTSIQREIPILDLGAQYASISDEINRAIMGVLQTQHFILGPEVEALEQEVAGFCGRRFGVGVASGTDALILSLAALGVGPGDEVIVPSLTFIGTADSISLLGATPVFADIEENTFNLDAGNATAKITRRTKAIVPVHLYGQSADMDRILELARRHNLYVIEDSAQAIGATYKTRKTGSMGDLGCISFFPSKNLGACGDGGMIVTDSGHMADQLRALRAHGSRKKYFSQFQGWNSRLDAIQAAVLRVKLRHLDDWSAARRANAAIYDQLLGGQAGIVVPVVAGWGEHVYHQYTVRFPHRDRVQEFLHQRGIGTSVYYPVPIHLQPIYKRLKYKPGDLPNTERACREVLSLPMYPELTRDQIERVAAAAAEAVRTVRA